MLLESVQHFVQLEYGENVWQQAMNFIDCKITVFNTHQVCKCTVFKSAARPSHRPDIKATTNTFFNYLLPIPIQIPTASSQTWPLLCLQSPASPMIPSWPFSVAVSSVSSAISVMMNWSRQLVATFVTSLNRSTIFICRCDSRTVKWRVHRCSWQNWMKEALCWFIGVEGLGSPSTWWDNWWRLLRRFTTLAIWR